MLSSGRPTGTTSGTEARSGIGQQVANVVVSVGPYPSTSQGVPTVVGPVLRGGRSVATGLLLSAVAIVAVPLQHATAPVSVDYRADLAALTRAAPFPVVAPAGLPRSWTPVSSAVAVRGANGPGTVTWHLGYMTPAGGPAPPEGAHCR